MEWKITNLTRTEPDNVVTTVFFKILLRDGEHAAGNEIYQNVPYKSPSDPTFVPFDNLTEEEIIIWVQQQLGPEKIAEMQEGLQRLINQSKEARQTTQGLPW